MSVFASFDRRALGLGDFEPFAGDWVEDLAFLGERVSLESDDGVVERLMCIFDIVIWSMVIKPGGRYQ